MKYKDKIFAGLFLTWGLFVIVYYFYNFSYYGEAFISSVAISIALILFIINILALFRIILVIFCPHFKSTNFIVKISKKILGKINNLQIPLYFFPLFLYFFAFVWIFWIYRASFFDIVSLGNNFIVLFLTSWIFLISFSFGYKILKVFKYKTNIFLEKFLFSCALGFGTLIIVIYFLGMFGLYYRSIAYVLMILITVITFREIKELWFFLKDKNNSCDLRKKTWFERILLFLILFILGVYIVGIFQQFPTGWDAFYCYLTYPDIFVKNHGIVNFPYWVYFGFPQNGEMLFVLGFLLFDFRIVLGIIFIFTLLIVIAVYYFFKRNKLKGGFYAILISLTLPVIFYQNLEDHKIEIIFVFYVILSYVLFINYLKNKGKKDLYIFSFSCGIASGLKYFFLGWYIVPLFIIFFIQILRKKLKIKDFIIWGVIVFTLMLPWFFKNIKFSGNPIDPILSEKIASKQIFYNSLGEDAQKYIVGKTRDEAYLIWDDEQKKDLSYFLRLPLKISFEGNKKYTSDALNMGFIFILFTPLLIIHTAKGIVNKSLKKEFIVIFFSVILLYLGWIYIGHVIMWYGISLFILMSVLISQVFLNKNRYLKLFSCLFLIIWAVSIINLQFNKRENYLTLYLRNNSIIENNYYLITKFINNNLNDKGLIWGLDEPRGYYVNNSNNRYIQDNYVLTFGYLLENKDEKEMLKFFKQFNIKYFLWRGMNNSENLSERMLWAKMPNGSEEYANFTLDNYKRVIKFKNKHMKLITQEGDFYLYKLKEE